MNKYLIVISLLGMGNLLNAQRVIEVRPENKGSKKLEITDCFSFKNLPNKSQFMSVEGKNFLLKQYSWSKTDKGRHYYKIPVFSTSKEEIWINQDSLIAGWNSYQIAQKDNSLKDFNPANSSLHFYDMNNGWVEGAGFVVEFKRNSNGSIAFDLNYKYPSNVQASETVKSDEATMFSFGKRTSKVTAAVIEDNLYIINRDKKTQITFDGGNGIIYGQSAHRNEFGITKGIFWSPLGQKLAFYRQDERRVSNYPLLDITSRPANTNSIKYPMAGDSSHTVTIGIYDRFSTSKEPIYLKTEGPYDQYLTNITWSKDEKYIYIAWVSRDQSKLELRKYDAGNGKFLEKLYEEQNQRYVEPENGPAFLPNDGESFIWQSEKDGYNHLYLHKRDKIKQLTKGPWVVIDFLGFDPSGKYCLVNSTKDGKTGNALQRTPLLIEISTGKIFDLYSAKGMKEIDWNPETGLMIMEISNLNLPSETVVLDIDEFIKTIKKNEQPTPSLLETVDNPVKDFEMGKIVLGSIMNDSVELFTRTFYPPQFDSSKKYPVVVYVYGGPHAQMNQNKWLGGGNLWMAYMASKGFIVFTLDNRGSSHRGFDFESIIHRQLGEIEMKDQLAGVRYLKGLNFVDSNRLGIHGWSFGGFMTTSLMTRHPQVFKTGVAGGPVIDWKYYEIMYTERYMDQPSENPDGYNQNSLLQYASKLKNRLFMIHGADDDVVVLQHSLMFLDKCVKSSNDNLDYFIYPGHKHNVIGRDRVHLYKKVSQYFFDHL